MATKPFLDKRRGIWYGRFQLIRNGPWKQIKLGPHGKPYPPSRPPTKPPKEVADLWSELELRERRVRTGLILGEGGGTDLTEYGKTYRTAYVLDHRQSSIDSFDQYFARFVEFAATKKVTTVEGVSKVTCREFMEHRLSKGIAVSTIKNQCGYLSPVFSRAVDDDLITVNPWTQVRLPGKTDIAEPVFWTSEEVGKLVAGARTAWVSDLIAVLANTGMRVSAGLAMRWDWVDWEKGVITIPCESSKGRVVYSTPMNDYCRDVLTRIHARSKSDHVFPSIRGGHYGYQSAHKGFRVALKRSGVRTGTLHDLRHTFGRTLAIAGVPINVIQAMLGHASITMTQRYTKVTGEAGVAFMPGFSIGKPDVE